MPNPIKCTHLYTDADGESHFEDIEFDMSSIQYAPPAPALDISDPIEATKVSWMRFPDIANKSTPPKGRRLVCLLSKCKVCESSTTAEKYRAETKNTPPVPVLYKICKHLPVKGFVAPYKKKGA
jgi:hypothetical protein